MLRHFCLLLLFTIVAGAAAWAPQAEARFPDTGAPQLGPVSAMAFDENRGDASFGVNACRASDPDEDEPEPDPL